MGLIGSGPENRKRYWFPLSVLGFAFFTIFFVPIPGPSIRATERTWWAAPRTNTVITGNSAVTHVSVCDGDRRTIPEILAVKSGRPVLDMSYNAQSFDESLLYAGQTLDARGNAPVVFLLSMFALGSRYPFDVQTQLFFRLVAGKLNATSLFGRFSSGRFLDPSTATILRPYTYKGRDYPDYDGLKATFFAREHDAMRCPENLGQDKAFIEASYWNNYLRNDWPKDNLEDLAALSRRARTSGRKFVVALLPIDFADIRALSTNLAMDVQQRSVKTVTALQASGVTVLDLSQTQPAEHFSDRWCACGHLLDEGRVDVASRIVVALQDN